MKPTVGRIVHYWPGPDQYGNRPSGRPLPAIILSVNDQTGKDGVDLQVVVKVFTLDGNDLVKKCWLHGSDEVRGGRTDCCSWPAREG